MAELVRREFEVDGKAIDFAGLMAKEQRRIYLLCFRMLRNSDEANTATQDVFIKAYRTQERQENDSVRSPAKWLTRVAVNTCLDRLRSKRWQFWQRRASYEDPEILRLRPTSSPNQEDALLSREIARRLELALGKLSIRQRSVFLLRHEEDYNLDEISEILGIDRGTVKAHMARAVQKLRKELRDLYGKQSLE